VGCKLIILCLILFCQSLWASDLPSAREKELPKWELGAGVAGLRVPHYLGANEFNEYGVPYPILVYRNEYIQADRKGLKGKLFQRDDLRISISAGSSLPVDSDESDAREGMPDLDFMLEIGPTLQYRFYQNREKSHSWIFNFPIRAAFVVRDFDIAHQGWESSPSVIYYGGRDGWKPSVSIGPMFGSLRYHQYFYDVERKYVTNDRGVYDSKSGYAGLKISFSLYRKFQQFSVAGFVKYVDLRAAINKSSPLIQTDNYVTFGMAINWMFAESTGKVKEGVGF